MSKYVKWSDDYREKMERKYHQLSVKTGLYNIGNQPEEHLQNASGDNKW